MQPIKTWYRLALNAFIEKRLISSKNVCAIQVLGTHLVIALAIVDLSSNSANLQLNWCHSLKNVI